LLFFNLLQQLPSCVSCSSSSYVSKNSTPSAFSSLSHYSLSCAYMNSWPHPLLAHHLHLHICSNNPFLSYLLFLSFNCDYKNSWPPLPFLFILFIFVCTCKKFQSSFFLHSIHFYCESFPLFLFIVFVFVLCLQELLTLPLSSLSYAYKSSPFSYSSHLFVFIYRNF
jgi:hypothetical protein